MDKKEAKFDGAGNLPSIHFSPIKFKGTKFHNDNNINNNNRQSDVEDDYFLFKKSSIYHTQQGPLSPSIAVPTSSTSSFGSASLFNMPQLNMNRRPSNINFYLSPVVTTPTGLDDYSTSNNVTDSPITLSSIPNKLSRDIPDLSLLHELEKRAYALNKDSSSLYSSATLPHDYLNISLEDGKYHSKDKTDNMNSLSQILSDYELKSKFRDEDQNDVISCYLAQHKTTKQKFVIRFISNLTVGSVSRLVNCYYITTDYKSRKPTSGFPHFVHGLEWDYEPRTCPSNLPGIYSCSRLEFSDDHLGLVSFYPIDENVIPLNKLKFHLESDIPKIIIIAVNILKALKNIHKYGIVNNSLMTSNILINPETLDIHIIGFDFAFSSAQEFQEVTYRSANRSTSLNYIPFTAPENFDSLASVDLRADEYGAGMIIYSLFSDKFMKNQNIFRIPVLKLTSKYHPLHDINDLIPPRLSQILSKMIEVEVNARYSSLDYIIHDLAKFYFELTSIKLSYDNVSTSLKRMPIIIPSQMVGRKKIMKFLLDEISTSSIQTFTLTGNSGIGKTTLLESLKIHSIHNKMFFTKWECSDLTHSESKFQTFDFILSQILRDILSRDKADVLFWRNLLSIQIKEDLSMLFDTVPELKILLGSRYRHIRRPKMHKMVYQRELSHHFMLKEMFELFIKNGGWVLVLENIDQLSESVASFLQEFWLHLKSDSSDENLNFTLLTSYTTKNSKNLLDAENVPSFVKQNILAIEPLGFEDVRELVNLSLYLYDSQLLWKKIESKEVSYYYEITTNPKFKDEREEIAKWIYDHSEGTPLRIKEILTQLHFIQLESPEPLPPLEVYKRYLKNIDQRFLCGSFFLNSIDDDVGLSSNETVRILKYATCISDSNSFNMYDLSIVSAIDISKLHKVLFTGAIVTILISCSVVSKLPLSHLNDPKFPLDRLTSTEKTNLLKFTRFKFVHENVKANLLDQMNYKNEFQEFHRSCGLRLFKHLKNKHHPLKLSSAECFSIANHFISSWEAAREHEYKIYCNILITAGFCAYSSHDHLSALKYFQIAKRLTSDEVILKGLNWIEIHIYSLKGKNEKCIELIEQVLITYKEDCEDKAQFMIAKFQNLRSLNRWEEAYNVCLDTFTALNFPQDLKTMTVKEIEEYTNTVLRPRLPTSASEIRELKKLPPNSDRKILLTQLALSELNQFAVVLGKRHLLEFANMKSLLLFMEHGRSMYCAFSMIVLASLGATSDAKGLKKAYEYCKLAFGMITGDSMEEHELFITCFRWYCGLVGSLIEPLDKIAQSIDISIMNSTVQIFESMLTRGFLLKFKFHVWLTQGFTLFRLRENLLSIKESMEQQGKFLEFYNRICNIVIGVLHVLSGDLSYDDYVKSGGESDGKSLNSLYLDLLYSTNLTFLCYFLKKYELGAVIARTEVYPACLTVAASIELIWSRFGFTLLTYKDRIRRIDNDCLQDPETIKKIDDMLKENLSFFEECSSQNPPVFMCMYKAIDALLKVLDYKFYSQIDILSSFESAIETCNEYNNYLFAAIVAEECARWLKRVSKSDTFTTKYFKIAYSNYKTWGLTIKVNQLVEELGSIVEDINLNSQFSKSRRTSRYFSQEDSLLFQQYSISNMDGLISMSKSSSIRKLSDRASAISNFESNSVSELKSEDGTNEDLKSCSSRMSNDLSNDDYNFPKHIDSVSTTNSLVDEHASTGIEEENSGISSLEDIQAQDDDWDNEVVMDLAIKIAQSSNVENILQTLLLFSIHFVKADYGCIILNSDDGTPFVKAICLKDDQVRFMSGELLSLRGDLVPVQVIQESMRNDQSIWRDSDKFYFDTTYRVRDPYFQVNDCESVFCIPIRSSDCTIVGALYLENQRHSSFIRSKKINLLEYICLQSFISISKTEMFERLEIAKKAAEEATADKASFLANMSHEIRTPFNSLMSCAIFLLDTNLTNSQRMYVETIKNSALVTLNIIDGILSFSKLEHGSLTLAYEPFDLRLCIEDAIQLVAEQAESKNLELVFIDNNYLIENVYGDKTRITQVIINLLGNSTKFTNKGYVLIETSAINISEDRYEFKITVKDSGIGIPPGHKNKLFKVFSQLDGSSKRIYGGSGLGLAISKKLAEFMGGDLTFSSIEGVGTEFYFTFTSTVESLNTTDNGLIGISKDRMIVIFDERELSSLSLKDYIETRGKSVQVFDKINENNMELALGADFVFIHCKLAKNEDQIRRLRRFLIHSTLILEIPFGMRIPEYIESNSEKTKLIDYILFNPFKRKNLEEILKNGKDLKNRTEKNTVNDKGKIDSDKQKQKIKLGTRCPLSILVAEDNFINTKVVRLQLKRFGYESDHAKDGVEAIEMSVEKFEKDGKPYDLILMDLQMPRKDGYEATEEIRTMYGENTVVVALSANVYAEEKKKCINIGMSGFLHKPLLPEALAVQLEKVYYSKN